MYGISIDEGRDGLRFSEFKSIDRFYLTLMKGKKEAHSLAICPLSMVCTVRARCMVIKTNL